MGNFPTFRRWWVGFTDSRWPSWLLGAGIVAVLLVTLAACAAQPVPRPQVERLEHLADQVQASSLSAATLASDAVSARKAANEDDALAASLFKDGRKGEAEERRVAAKVARLRAQDLEAQARSQQAIADAGQKLLADGREEIRREDERARADALKEAKAVKLAHLITLATIIGGGAFLGGMALLVVARLWPMVGAFIDWHAPVAIGAGGLAMAVAAQALGTAMPHLVKLVLAAGALVLAGLLAWLVVAIARKGRAGTAAGATFADDVIDLLHDVRGQLTGPQSTEACSRLDGLKLVAGVDQDRAGVRRAVQVVRGLPVKPLPGSVVVTLPAQQ